MGLETDQISEEVERLREALRQSETRFRSLVESNIVGIALGDTAGWVNESNDAFLEMVGYDQSDLPLRWDRLTPPEFRDQDFRAIEQLRRTGRCDLWEKEYVRKDGGRVRVLIGIVALESLPDRTRCIAFVLDLSERKRAHQALWQSEERFRRLAESNIIGIIEADTSGWLTEANDAFLQMTGYARTDLPLRWDLLTPPEFRHLDELAIDRLRSNGKCDLWEKEYIRKDGRRLPILVGVAVLETFSDRVNCVAFILDLTERKRAEQALRQSQEQLALVVSQLPACLWTTDRDQRITSSVGSGLAALGVKPHQLVGMTMAEYLGTDDPNFVPLAATRRALAGDSSTYEFDWQGIFFQTFIQPLRGPGGEIIGTIGLAADVTPRRKAEDELRKLSQAVEQSPSIVIITDQAFIIQYVNPKFVQITGYEREEVVGRHVRTLGGEPGPEEAGLWEALAAGQEWHGEFQNRRKNGEAYWMTASVSPIRSADDTVTHYVGVHEDITERKLLEEQLRHAQKLEAVGQLAGGIAHDFNNYVTVTRGFGELLLRYPLPERQRRYVEEIMRASGRAADLTRQLLTFSRRQKPQPSVLDLNRTLGDRKQILTRLLGTKVELVMALDPELRFVHVDPGQIDQLIVNLTANARDAMPRGGRLTVTTANVVLVEKVLRHGQEIAPGPYVTLSFADTGCGMDETTRSRIFEPFFTTKDVGQGTGLGLATVYGIVQQSGGCIDVASEPDRGSRFTLYLPPTAEPLPAEEPKVEPAPLPQGAETILLVEDDDGVRTLAWQVLEDCGYTVLDARHGQEALAVSQEFPDEIHLVLTDLTMPEITGPELVRRLRPGRPAIKVLYMSGHADSARSVTEPVRLLAKPFAAEDLARKVRETLGNGAS